MPTQLRRENEIISRFLLGYEDRSWCGAAIDPLDTRVDGAVEVVAIRASDGLRLAIEHTIIEPFKEDKQDFALFSQSGFLGLEKDESLQVPGTWLRVFIPVGTLRGHRTATAQQALVEGVRDWLAKNRLNLPRGQSDHRCQAKLPTGRLIQIPLRIEVVIPFPRAALNVRRQQVQDNLGEVIENALVRKLPKLINTPAQRRILLLERQHMNLLPSRMLAEVDKCRPRFPQLALVDIWIVETMAYDNESILYFEHYEQEQVKAAFLVEADGSVWD